MATDWLANVAKATQSNQDTSVNLATGLSKQVMGSNYLAAYGVTQRAIDESRQREQARIAAVQMAEARKNMVADKKPVVFNQDPMLSNNGVALAQQNVANMFDVNKMFAAQQKQDEMAATAKSNETLQNSPGMIPNDALIKEHQNNIRKAQMEAYGQGTPVVLPNGATEMRWSGDQKYYGITPEMQARGFLPTDLPNALPANATEEEKNQWNMQMRQAYKIPKYTIGYENTMLTNMTRGDKALLQKKMIAAGLYKPSEPVNLGTFGANDLIHLNTAMAEANLRGTDIDGYLKMAAQARVNGGGGGAGGSGSGKITRQVQIVYPQTSLAQGRTLLAQVLANALGQPPTDEQLRQFMAELNAAESKSPSRTITNYVTAGNTQTTTSRTTPSGVDAGQMARDFAARIGGGDQFFEYAANDVMGTVLNAIRGGSSV